MTNSTKRLSKKDLDILLELYNIAQTTPVITTAVSKTSFADTAWDKVREFQKELGKKYGYDWQTHGINGEGEGIPI